MPDQTPVIDCRSALRQLWDYLDGELDDERMREVHRHLHACEECLPHAEFGRRFLDALHAARGRSAMPAGVRSQVIASLAEVGFTAD